MIYIKYLMTNGPRKTVSFVSRRSSMFSKGEAERNIEVERKQKSLFPAGRIIKCFVMPPNSKLKKKKKMRRNRLLYAGWFINFLQFQGARPAHVRIESLCLCFPMELLCFDLTTRDAFSPIRKTYLSLEI